MAGQVMDFTPEYSIHFSVREDSIVHKVAAYVVLGINTQGKKEVLSLVIGENENSKYCES